LHDSGKGQEELLKRNASIHDLRPAENEDGTAGYGYDVTKTLRALYTDMK